MHRQTNEGGSIEEEFRTEYVADRVNTFGTAMLGLTLECARCHDHKFDPITQRDYFSLFAFFNNIDESGLYSHYTNATPSPSLLLWSAEKEKLHKQLKARIASTEQDAGRHRESGRASLPGLAEERADRGRRRQSRSSRRRRSTFNGDDAVVPPGMRLFTRTDAFSFVLRLHAHRAPGPRGRPAPVPLVVGRGQPRLRADARPRPAVLRPDPLLAGQRHRGAREAAAADERVVPPGGDLRRLEPRGGHPPVSQRRAARRRGRARPPLQGHHLPQGGGRRCEGAADADAGRAVQGQRVQERADPGPAGLRHGADRGGSGRDDPRATRPTPRARRTSWPGTISRTSRAVAELKQAARRRERPDRGRPRDHGDGRDAHAAGDAPAEARRLRRARRGRAARHAGEPAAVPGGPAAQPPRPRALAHGSPQPARRPRRRQPHLADALRPRPGRNAGRLRQPGPAAHAIRSCSTGWPAGSWTRDGT